MIFINHKKKKNSNRSNSSGKIVSIICTLFFSLTIFILIHSSSFSFSNNNNNNRRIGLQPVNGLGVESYNPLTVPENPITPKIIEYSETSHSIDIKWKDKQMGYSDSIDAYEIQYRPIFYDNNNNNDDNNGWLNTDNGIIGENQKTQNEIHILSVRVDPGRTIQDGYFRLAFNYDGLISIDTEEEVITVPIAYNAGANEVKAALEGIETIQNVKVRRCDSLGGDGGVGGYYGHCPDFDGNAFSWHIMFDPPSERGLNYRRRDRDALAPVQELARADLPLLTVWKERIAAKWSGSGPQVTIIKAGPGVIDNTICHPDNNECRVSIPNLFPGTGYSFRMRARNSMGWSLYSHETSIAFTKPLRVPPAPLAPVLSSASIDSITVAVGLGSTFQSDAELEAYEAEFRKTGTYAWITIPEVTMIGRGKSKNAYITAKGLEPDSEYEFHVRAKNAIGYSRFSTPSVGIKNIASLLIESTQPVVDLSTVTEMTLTIHWQLKGVEIFDPTVKCQVQYSTNLESYWRTMEGFVTFDKLRKQLDLSKDVKNLQPYTVYQFRTRAIKGRDYTGPWSLPSAEIRTNAILPSFSFSSLVTSNDNSFVMSAQDNGLAGNHVDPDYLTGVGAGGDDGHNGGDGLAIIIAYVPYQPEPARTLLYFNGEPQEYTVPRSSVAGYEIEYIDIKLWGGGGGGGRPQPSNITRGSSFSHGGAGGFAQARLKVTPGETLTVIVGGSGASPGYGGGGGAGGYNGGEHGGTGDHGGGGGGGHSEVRRREELLILAAGGGGGGATDYCCAHGGGAGGSVGSFGTAPGLNTPLDNSDMDRPARREYTSPECDRDYCFDPRDSKGLSATHQSIDQGFAPKADYLYLSMGGEPGTNEKGGLSGKSGSYEFATSGALVAMGANGDSYPLVAHRGHLSSLNASSGYVRHGGRGADGKDAGGGGGGGYFGGGGGGSGVDGAGGGGGSSYINSAEVYIINELQGQIAPQAPYQPSIVNVNNTAATLSWSAPPVQPIGQEVVTYDVELAQGIFNEDFKRIAVLHYSITTYSATGLIPETNYRMRIRANTRKSFGPYSAASAFQTGTNPVNEWKRIIPRRLAIARRGRGLSATVTNVPHIDPIAQTRTEGASVDQSRFTDPPTNSRHTSPSARRGHTMSVIDGIMFLYGGYSEGYRCDAGITDTIALGFYQNTGILIDKCRLEKAENSELWRYDPITTIWEMLEIESRESTASQSQDTSWNHQWPPARSMHSATVVNDKMYVFGGIAYNDSDNLNYNDNNDINAGGYYLNDVWEMDPGTRLEVSIDTGTANETIPQGGKTFITTNLDVPSDMCIVDMKVYLEVDHGCTRQLKITLFGPGPNTHDANFFQSAHAEPVVLFNNHDGRLSGCGVGIEGIRFDDGAESYVGDCCQSPFKGNFRPFEKLSDFDGIPATGEWTLEVYDNQIDDISGSVKKWTMDFVLDDCWPTYKWTNLTKENEADRPIARFQHSAITVDNDIYVFGGYQDYKLFDMWRFNTITHDWTQLTTNAVPANSDWYGRALTLTPYGLFAFGGYTKKYNGTYNPGEGSDYDSSVWRQDLITQRWKMLGTSNKYQSTDPYKHRAEGVYRGDKYPDLEEDPPEGRMMTAMVMLSQAHIPSGDELSLNVWSSLSIFRNVSLVIFGGYDGRRYLDDFRELTLDHLVSEEGFEQVQVSLDGNCAWRIDGTAFSDNWKNTCSEVDGASQIGPCDLNNVLLQAFCAGQYQSINNL